MFALKLFIAWKQEDLDMALRINESIQNNEYVS